MTNLNRCAVVAWALVANAVFGVVRTYAQDDTTKASPATSKTCYRGLAATGCRRFILTELTLDKLLVGQNVTFTTNQTGSSLPYTSKPNQSRLSGEISLMTNRSLHTALGASLLLREAQEGGNVGVKLRYRRWLHRDGAALDIGAGLVSGRNDGSESRVLLFTSDVALNVGDYVGVTLGADTRSAGGNHKPLLYGGLRLGSQPAWIGAALFGIIYVIVRRGVG
ncbi:MAG: hypothetical protein ABJB66_00655 [Gemmatimonadaceae bacterium]